MSSFDFFLIFNDNIVLYVIIAAIVVGLDIYYVNKLADSWLNPFKYMFFQFGIGISVAVFLYQLKLASFYSFSYVIISTILFCSILFFLYPRHIGSVKINISNDFQCQKAFFILSYSIYILSTLLTYSLRGIPIFNEDSRLTTFTGAGGLGVIERFSPFFVCYSLFYIYNKLLSKRISKLGFCLLMSPFIIFGVLSGSRSSFLTFVFAFWGYKLFYKGVEIQLSSFKKLLIPVILVTLFTFALERSTTISGAWTPMFNRIVSCGDLYWFSLPNDVWKNVIAHSPWADVSVGLLAPLRVISEDDADMAIGFQVTRLVYEGFENTTGPVELFPISTLIYFGYFGGLLFTIFQACFVSKLCSFFFKKSSSLIISSFLYYCFWRSLYFLGSFRDGMGQIFAMIVSFVVLILFSMLIGCRFTYKKTKV